MVKKVQDRSNDADVIDRPPKEKKEPNRPGNFAVALHNDDFTSMDFVVYVLQEIFNHPQDRAERIMLEVHEKGMGVAGIYNFEIAEQKAYDTAAVAKENEFPLKISIKRI
jgi:ATP-dependent Clp protease adaptor protein ClpS